MLVLPAILAAAAIWCLPDGGAAAAAECEWQPHRVRVVKQVKRHGKRVRLVRTRVRWGCVPVAAALAPPTPTPVATAPAPARPEPAPLPTFAPEDLGNPHFLGAQAYEFGFTPTKPSFELEAGADTIELINVGQDEHDLHLESLTSGAQVLAISGTASNGQARASAVLAPGEYRLYCSIDDHATAHGMERRLVVTP